MSGNILVLAEQWRVQLSEISFEILALGRELAESLDVSLEAVLLGDGMKGLSNSLGAADKVFSIDDPLLAEPIAELQCNALAPLIRERRPRCVLVPLTNAAVDTAGLLPAILPAPFINSCRDVKVVDGKIQAECLLYGGKMVASVAPSGETVILGILPGVRSAADGMSDKEPEVEEIKSGLSDQGKVRFTKYIEPEAGDVDITQQEVLISVGRGFQSQDDIEVAEELASALGGAVCGSRPVIDQNWLPLSRQVGKSGVIVKPKMYIAAGISGAPEHVEGMKGAGLIIAINTDPDAPIFGVAHYGITEDVMDLLPALMEAVETHKASV